MKLYSWIGAIVGVVAGSGMLFNTLTSSTVDSAPKQAAGAAIAVALVVIPYCFARAVEALSTSTAESELKQLNETLATHTVLLASLANSASPIAGNRESVLQD
jgi:hypothetical protein